MTLQTLGLLAWLAAWPPGVLAQTVEQGGSDPGRPEATPPHLEATKPQRESDRRSALDIATFLAGGAVGLGLHEGGHLLMSSAFGADPGIRQVSFGPLPFFAISHEDVSPAEEYAIAAAGFWMQHASSEWLLSRQPGLRHQRAPLAKGLLAFNVLTSAAYATAAFGTFGPYERDTRAMADALDVSEPWVGAMVLAPAALDTWRYLRPDSRWAAWTSRALKVGVVLVVVRAARQ